MPKNLTLFRLGADCLAGLALDAAEEALQKNRFVPCGAKQPQSAGWVSPRGVDGAPLVESVGGECDYWSGGICTSPHPCQHKQQEVSP